METVSLTLFLAVNGILVACLGGLLWMLLAQRGKTDTTAAEHAAASERLARELSNYKTHVAEHYVSKDAMKQVEDRLTVHLIRIETKLDARS